MADQPPHIPEPVKVAQAVPQIHQGIPVQQAVQAQPVYYPGQPQPGHPVPPPPGHPQMQPLPQQMTAQGKMPGAQYCDHGQHLWGPARPTAFAWVVCVVSTIFFVPLCCSLFICTTKKCQECHLREEKLC